MVSHIKFVDMIATLHTEATSEILVNGFHTPTFTIRRGVRQGDAYSLFLFLIAVEPFLTAIRHNNNISGIQTPGRFKIKALSYVDDITMTVANMLSVTHLFSTLQQLEVASRLKLNYSKTHGLHTSRTANTTFLRQIQWTSKCLQLLGSSIGAHESVASQWDKCARNSTAMAKTYSTFFLTMTEKSVIVKSKILPLMTYNANGYPLPHKIRQKINTTIELIHSRKSRHDSANNYTCSTSSEADTTFQIFQYIVTFSFCDLSPITSNTDGISLPRLSKQQW